MADESSTATLSPSEAAANSGLNSLSSLFTDVPVVAETPAPVAPAKEPTAAPVVEKPTEAAKPVVPPVEPTKKPEAAKPKADAPKPEVKPVEPAKEIEEFLETVKPQTRSRFNELVERGVAERLKTAPQAKPEETEAFKALAVERDRLQTELIKFGVEQSPEYKAEFVERPKELQSKITSILETYDIDQAAFFKALANPTDKASRIQLNTLLEEVGVIDRVEASQVVLEMMAIEKKKATVSGDPATALKVLQEAEAGKRREYVTNLVKSRQAALEPILGELETKAAAFFDSEGAGEEGKAQTEALMKAIRQANGIDLETMKPEDRVKMLTSAFLATPLNKALTAAQAKNAELQARLDKYEKGAPGLSGPAHLNGKTEDDEPDLIGSVFGVSR